LLCAYTVLTGFCAGSTSHRRMLRDVACFGVRRGISNERRTLVDTRWEESPSLSLSLSLV